MRAHGCSGSSLRCWSIHSESNAGTRVARASPSLRQPDQRSSQRQLARRGRVASVSVPTKARPFPHAIPTADTVARERIGATTEDDGAGLEMRHHFLDYGLEDRIVRRVVHPCTHTQATACVVKPNVNPMSMYHAMPMSHVPRGSLASW